MRNAVSLACVGFLLLMSSGCGKRVVTKEKGKTPQSVVNDLDAIIDVDGVDSICIGPMDLSSSMGILGQSANPKLLEVINTIVAKVSKSEKILGIATGYNQSDNGAFIKELCKKNLQWACVNSDFSNLSYFSKQILENVRSITNS